MCPDFLFFLCVNHVRFFRFLFLLVLIIILFFSLFYIIDHVKSFFILKQIFSLIFVLNNLVWLLF